MIGDAVNLSSRLEGATKEYGVSILTTEQTLNQIKESGKNLPSHRFLDRLKVKGKNEAVQVVHIFEQDAPLELSSAFQRAMGHYLKQNWDEAIAHFENCNRIYKSIWHEEDKTSLIFIERSKSWKQDSPPHDWDGSWTLTSK